MPLWSPHAGFFMRVNAPQCRFEGFAISNQASTLVNELQEQLENATELSMLQVFPQLLQLFPPPTLTQSDTVPVAPAAHLAPQPTAIREFLLQSSSDCPFCAMLTV